jgi:hypothetical protein
MGSPDFAVELSITEIPGEPNYEHDAKARIMIQADGSKWFNATLDNPCEFH